MPRKNPFPRPKYAVGDFVMIAEGDDRSVFELDSITACVDKKLPAFIQYSSGGRTFAENAITAKVSIQKTRTRTRKPKENWVQPVGVQIFPDTDSVQEQVGT